MCLYVGLWTMPESSKKLITSTGRVQRCSSEWMSCVILCWCVCGQCRRTCSVSAGPCPQLAQETSWASPSLCMYKGTSVEWPHWSRPSCIRCQWSRVTSVSQTTGPAVEHQRVRDSSVLWLNSLPPRTPTCCDILLDRSQLFSESLHDWPEPTLMVNLLIVLPIAILLAKCHHFFYSLWHIHWCHWGWEQLSPEINLSAWYCIGHLGTNVAWAEAIWPIRSHSIENSWLAYGHFLPWWLSELQNRSNYISERFQSIPYLGVYLKRQYFPGTIFLQHFTPWRLRSTNSF